MLGLIFEMLDLPDLFSMAGRPVPGGETCAYVGETHVWLGDMSLCGRDTLPCGIFAIFAIFAVAIHSKIWSG